ncbi:CAP domain-containing protein [Allochromatium palmeri]|uniref:CAP domain-containing protein n=1 Tax=Allochromatium palmeri TaxID=231048 RepID=UPI001CA412DB|nr:CAP domain-containing protein [Allochromatium palmeri]
MASLPSDALLFADDTTAELAIPDQATELALRQRLVRVQLDALPLEPGSELVLDLFDDQPIWLVCDDVGEEEVLGSRSWWGHGADDAGIQAHLAVSERTLSGTILTPDASFQIRPFDDTWHIVRELRREARSPDFAGLIQYSESQSATATVTATAFETETATLTNNERQMNGLHRLAWNDLLLASARGHSIDMATNGYFSHTGLDGRDSSDRISDAGYSWNYAAENIAAGQTTPIEVVDAWMNSPGHRANILNSVVCDLGVGYTYDAGSYYRHYWTQNFGRQQGVGTCPPIPMDDENEAKNYYRKVNAYFYGTFGRSATSGELAEWGAVLRDNSGSVWKPMGEGLQHYLSNLMGWGAGPLDVYTAGSIVDQVLTNLFGWSWDIDPHIINYYVEALVEGYIRPRGLVNAILNDLVIMPRADGTYSQPNGWTGGGSIRGLLTSNQFARYRERIESTGF